MSTHSCWYGLLSYWKALLRLLGVPRGMTNVHIPLVIPLTVLIPQWNLIIQQKQRQLVLLYFPVAVIKHSNLKQSWGERGYLTLLGLTSSVKEARMGTQGRN